MWLCVCVVLCVCGFVCVCVCDNACDAQLESLASIPESAELGLITWRHVESDKRYKKKDGDSASKRPVAIARGLLQTQTQ